jgi:hypothetical protein
VLAVDVDNGVWCFCAQVKSVEEQYSSHMRQLELQLEEALQQQQQAEAAAAAAEAAAAEAAAAAAAAAGAVDGSGHGTRYLPAIDTSSAAEKTLQLLDKLMMVRPALLVLVVSLVAPCGAAHALMQQLPAAWCDDLKHMAFSACCRQCHAMTGAESWHSCITACTPTHSIDRLKGCCCIHQSHCRVLLPLPAAACRVRLCCLKTWKGCEKRCCPAAATCMHRCS